VSEPNADRCTALVEAASHVRTSDANGAVVTTMPFALTVKDTT